MLKRLLRQNETYLTILIVLLCVGITIGNPAFLTYENVAGFLKSYSMVGIMAVGTLLRAHPERLARRLLHRHRPGGRVRGGGG